MERLQFDDIELIYQRRDGGEPVVSVHAAPFVAWYGPILERLDRFSTVSYRRHLRSTDARNYRPLTAAEDAAICARLMDHVGWKSAHVVGHSYGALVAVQLAATMPERVTSVA